MNSWCFNTFSVVVYSIVCMVCYVQCVKCFIMTEILDESSSDEEGGGSGSGSSDDSDSDEGRLYTHLLLFQHCGKVCFLVSLSPR